jgi:leucyl-tRNA synthetase
MGVTYVTLAPEHPLVSAVTSDDRRDEVNTYVEAMRNGVCQYYFVQLRIAACA